MIRTELKLTEPVNPNAQQEVRKLLRYLGEVSGNAIITGQHTQTMEQAELKYIEEATGKLPALCGFELLAYSPNINYPTCNEACLKEIEENRGTLTKVWDWAKKGGLITMCWHWFSPMGGKDKAFYAENTDFDAARAVMEGTPEYRALLSDMDQMADYLKPFCEKHIPILWRPFHEGDGDWFWWGAKGPETVKKLYRIMFERYTKLHRLDNLIWVWNAPSAACYPGDDVCDIISRDMYPPAHQHDDRLEEYEELVIITDTKKICAIGEIGPIPSVSRLSESRAEWAYFMTWSNDFGRSERFTARDELCGAYRNPYAVTLDKLPVLYRYDEK